MKTVVSRSPRRRIGRRLGTIAVFRAGADTALLALVSLVVLAGLWLVYGARSDRFPEERERLRSGETLNLNAVRDPKDLERFLPDLEGPDRAFAARKLFERLPGGGGARARNVGLLGRIRVPVAEIDAAPGLAAYAKRADEAAEGRAGPRGELRVRLFTAEQVAVLKPNLVVRTPGNYRNALFASVLLYLFAFHAAHVFLKSLRPGGDPLLLPVAHLVTGLGLIMMVSLRDPLREFTLFDDFSAGVAFGCAAMALAALPNYQNRDLSRLAFVPLLLACALSMLLIVFGSGPGGSDAKVRIFGFFQPADLIQLLMIFFLASYFARRWAMLRALGQPPMADHPVLNRLRLPRVDHVLPVLAGVIAASALFFLQKDLGPALITGLVFLALYAVSRARARLALAGLAFLIAGFWVASLAGRPDTVALRVAMWRSPWQNAEPRGDHVAESIWALASGGVTGTGLGLGAPALAPESHTDLVLSAVGEELGFIGLLAVAALFAVFLRRAFAIALSAPGDYTFFLALGLAAAIGFRLLVMAGGVIGLVPLTGVVTPFLSYGKTAMIVNFGALGILWSISRHGTKEGRRASFGKPVAGLAAVLILIGAAAAVRAATIQIARADEYLARPCLTMQADGSVRSEQNRRLLLAASMIPRGAILDRNGLPLATSRWEDLEAHRDEYRALGIDIDRDCSPRNARHYPLGGAMFHLLGDLTTRLNWGAVNASSYIERDANARLQGFDDHARTVKRRSRSSGRENVDLVLDYTEVVPLWRKRHEPDDPAVQALLSRPRDVRATIDARLQMRTLEALRRQAAHAGSEKAAAAVMDPANGDLLACVSLPAPRYRAGDCLEPPPGAAGGVSPALEDRVRWAFRRPGSAFKIVTASAALSKSTALLHETFECRALPRGRVGNIVAGRPIRDDTADRVPHGVVSMKEGTAVSCNAYYAQLGTRVGLSALEAMAARWELPMGESMERKERAQNLPHSACGQGLALASVFRMTRVAATIAGGGAMPRGRWIAEPADERSAPAAEVISPAVARMVAGLMRGAVLDGTGRVLRDAAAPVAGKTGTAEVANEASHAWFVGFAPYAEGGAPAGGGRIAFAVLIEHGGYGSRSAAPAAGEIVRSARDLGLIE